MNNEERCFNVDILNMIIDQAKYIRNVLVHNSPNVTIDFKKEVSDLKDAIKRIKND